MLTCLAAVSCFEANVDDDSSWQLSARIFGIHSLDAVDVGFFARTLLPLAILSLTSISLVCMCVKNSLRTGRGESDT